jgi:hypothetical protein
MTTDRDITERLRDLCDRYIAWQADGCPISDPYDVYPGDQWSTEVTPQVVRDLLGTLQAREADIHAMRSAARHGNAKRDTLRAEVARQRERAEKAEAERDALLSALAQCVESLRGYRQWLRDDQACDAEADAVRLLDAARAKEAERG